MKKIYQLTLAFTAIFSCLTLHAKKSVEDPNFTIVENCYQRVFGAPYYYGSPNSNPLNPTLKFKFLKSGNGGSNIKISTHRNDGPKIIRVRIEKEDGNVIFNDTDIDGNIILPIDAVKANFRVYTPTLEHNGTNPVDIEFVEPEFNLTNNGLECLPLTGLLNFSSNLDGLCREPNLRIKFPAGTIGSSALMGLDPNFKMDIPSNGYGYNIPVLNNNCDDQEPILPTNPPGWVPVFATCLDMEVEITLRACDEPDFDPSCPPLTFVKPIRFCCNCPIIP